MEEGGTATAASSAAATTATPTMENPTEEVPATLITTSTVPAPPPAPSPLSGGYLLIVIGEPHCEEHTQLILQRLAKGTLITFYSVIIISCLPVLFTMHV
jgi:hypothetical protein